MCLLMRLSYKNENSTEEMGAPLKAHKINNFVKKRKYCVLDKNLKKK
jgi:hypothetical protein